MRQYTAEEQTIYQAGYNAGYRQGQRNYELRCRVVNYTPSVHSAMLQPKLPLPVKSIPIAPEPNE